MLLTFTFRPAISTQLIIGSLSFAGQDTVWQCTSGLPNHQNMMDYLVPNKGPIPPTRELLKHNIGYTVRTEGVYCANKGIDGLFFPISPNKISLPNPAVSANGEDAFIYRSGFGIHRDANVPGSAGCPVLPDPEEFKTFSWFMGGLHARNIEEIDFNVIYI